jgi:hypothetical protein
MRNRKRTSGSPRGWHLTFWTLIAPKLSKRFRKSKPAETQTPYGPSKLLGGGIYTTNPAAFGIVQAYYLGSISGETVDTLLRLLAEPTPEGTNTLVPAGVSEYYPTGSGNSLRGPGYPYHTWEEWREGLRKALTLTSDPPSSESAGASSSPPREPETTPSTEQLTPLGNLSQEGRWEYNQLRRRWVLLPQEQD